MEALALDVMRRMAALAGYAWTDAELQAMAPLVARSLALFQKLESVQLGDLEPTSHFHME